ncbi:MAG: cation diffusion facilitator family transporter [Oligoflexus sp.]
MKLFKQPLLFVAFASAVLALIKILAYVFSGSMIVFSSALDSLGDSIVSYFNHRMHTYAKKQADREHPYGHGGFEVLSSLTQGLALISLAIIIIYRGIMRLIQPDDSVHLNYLGSAIVTLLIAAISGAALQFYLQKQQQRLQKRRETSLSMGADRAHYLGDFFLNFFSAGALFVVWKFGYVWIDAIAAIIGGSILLYVAFPILKLAYQHITHEELEIAIQQELVAMILHHHPAIHSLHRFRTRRLGPTIFIDFHLKLMSDPTLKESHLIAERLEAKIRKKYPSADVTIHVDPVDEPRHAENLSSFDHNSLERKDSIN